MAGRCGDALRGHGDARLGTRPVYLTRALGAGIEALAVRYALEPVGRLVGPYRVTGAQETQP